MCSCSTCDANITVSRQCYLDVMLFWFNVQQNKLRAILGQHCSHRTVEAPCFHASQHCPLTVGKSGHHAYEIRMTQEFRGRVAGDEDDEDVNPMPSV